jgi:hypothetical protein
VLKCCRKRKEKVMAKDKGKDRQAQKKERLRLAFYLKCSRCGHIYTGKETETLPGEIRVREYPRCCLWHDVQLMPEVQVFKEGAQNGKR